MTTITRPAPSRGRARDSITTGRLWVAALASAAALSLGGCANGEKTNAWGSWSKDPAHTTCNEWLNQMSGIERTSMGSYISSAVKQAGDQAVPFRTADEVSSDITAICGGDALSTHLSRVVRDMLAGQNLATNATQSALGQ